MTEKEHAIIKAVVNRGYCPYCGRPGLKNNYGSKHKHINSCSKLLSNLGKEKMFSHWISEAKENGRLVDQDTYDRKWGAEII